MELIKRHPAETLVEWGAPALLAAAAGWAAWITGYAPLAASAAAAVALVAGIAAMRLFGGTTGPALSPFEPLVLDICGEAGTDELLLDDPLEIAPDARVVRLFARQEATPGELLLRIEDYLNDGQRACEPIAAASGDGRPADASATLHEALANIRASLR